MCILIQACTAERETYRGKKAEVAALADLKPPHHATRLTPLILIRILQNLHALASSQRHYRFPCNSCPNTLTLQ